MDNGPSMDPRLAKWFASRDTGISSKAIALWLSARAKDNGWGDTVPSDGADFGRCYRLLQAFPEWRTRLSEMTERGGRWPILVKYWDEIERRYLSEIADPVSNRGVTYEYMSDLRDIPLPTPPETTV